MLRQTKNKVLGGLTQCTLAVSKRFQGVFGPTGLNSTFEPRNDEIETIGEFSFLYSIWANVQGSMSELQK